MSDENRDDNFSDINAFNKPELRSSYTTLTYINEDDDDTVSPDYVGTEFNDDESSTDFDNPNSKPSSTEKLRFTNNNSDFLHDVSPTDNNNSETKDHKDGNDAAHSDGLKENNNISEPNKHNGSTVNKNLSEPSVQIQNGHNSSTGVSDTNSCPTAIFSTNNLEMDSTPRITQTRFDASQTPLTKRRILILKCLAVAVAIFFFPAGIPAVYYAFKIDKAFQAGIMQGNIDLALKYAKRTEKLVILSLVLGVLFIVMCFAIIERAVYGNEYYWHHGTVAGRG
ncbi:hypothetical protein LOTGIDRAFT_169181 [Lottia gigantea]|uniref:Uncharacterized protein n=1 Tax=Lottia gigantea TaxID=225164 RepID=V3ZM29_LOTGI|nr:hypothetical protein LOTGIDRAFT_169181 [Lottia gigantea]ESO83490.1 hypothetical protein LOTGIDRAFT_169181 [Lottia gigantea]